MGRQRRLYVIGDGALPIAAEVGEEPEVDQRFRPLGRELCARLSSVHCAGIIAVLDVRHAEVVDAGVVRRVEAEAVVEIVRLRCVVVEV